MGCNNDTPSAKSRLYLGVLVGNWAQYSENAVKSGRNGGVYCKDHERKIIFFIALAAARAEDYKTTLAAANLARQRGPQLTFPDRAWVVGLLRGPCENIGNTSMLTSAWSLT